MPTAFGIRSMTSANGTSSSPIQSGHAPDSGRRHAARIISNVTRP
jgi:hypothetical protein